jgi:hypothetical protein
MNPKYKWIRGMEHLSYEALEQVDIPAKIDQVARGVVHQRVVPALCS